MKKEIDKLIKRIEELEADTYKLELHLITIKSTCEDRFNKLLGVLNGKGKMTSFSDYQEKSLYEELGIDNGF